MRLDDVFLLFLPSKTSVRFDVFKPARSADLIVTGSDLITRDVIYDLFTHCGSANSNGPCRVWRFRKRLLGLLPFISWLAQRERAWTESAPMYSIGKNMTASSFEWVFCFFLYISYIARHWQIELLSLHRRKYFSFFEKKRRELRESRNANKHASLTTSGPSAATVTFAVAQIRSQEYDVNRMSGLCRPYFSPLGGVGEINKAQIASKQKVMVAGHSQEKQQQAYKVLRLEVSGPFQVSIFAFSRGRFRTRLVAINLWNAYGGWRARRQVTSDYVSFNF